MGYTSGSSIQIHVLCGNIDGSINSNRWMLLLFSDTIHVRLRCVTGTSAFLGLRNSPTDPHFTHFTLTAMSRGASQFWLWTLLEVLYCNYCFLNSLSFWQLTKLQWPPHILPGDPPAPNQQPFLFGLFHCVYSDCLLLWRRPDIWYSTGPHTLWGSTSSWGVKHVQVTHTLTLVWLLRLTFRKCVTLH